MISASIAGTHRFGRVKKNGYDPAEVDAVVGRLLDDLSLKEERAIDLERKLNESQVSATAISRTLAAVETTSSEILADAQSEADGLRADARDEAEEIAVLAAALGAEVSATRDSILSQAYQEADDMIAECELATARQHVAASELAADIVAEATRSADAVATEAALRSRTSSMIAAWRIRESQEQSKRTIATSHTRASAIVDAAERESERLAEQINDLRAAVANLQASAAELAHTTMAEADVIDLNAIEASGELQPQRSVKLTPVPSDTPPVPEPSGGPATFYQRRTGGIKERIKIARLTP